VTEVEEGGAWGGGGEEEGKRMKWMSTRGRTNSCPSGFDQHLRIALNYPTHSSCMAKD